MPLNEDYSYDNPQNDSIDELERKNEKLEKNPRKIRRKFGESSEKSSEKSEKDQIEIKNGRITDIQNRFLKFYLRIINVSARCRTNEGFQVRV